MKIFTLIAISLIGLAGCQNSDSNLLNKSEGKWLIGNWKSEDGSAIQINQDGSFVSEVTFQVGVEGDKQVPYPTVCHYRQYGTLNMTRPSSRQIDSYKKELLKGEARGGAQVPQSEHSRILIPDVELEEKVTKCELIDAPGNGTACGTYIARSNASAPSYYTLEYKKQSDTVVTDAWYGPDFKKEN